MNIASNQTLILANERGVGGPPIAGSPRAWNAAVTGLLKRVTLLAAQPDSTVLYLQADYGNADPGGADPGRADHGGADYGRAEAASLPALVGSSSRVPAVSAKSATVPTASGLPVPTLPGRPSGGSSRGIALYASTQRGLADKPYGHIDVHA